MVRPQSGPLHPAVERIDGDVRDQEALAEAVKGADTLIHAAAKVGDWGAREGFSSVVVDGTRSALRAAQRAGVRRFVHVSSAAVYGLLGVRGRRVPETFRFTRSLSPWNHYGRSKVQAEIEVERAGATGSLSVAILRPTMIVGYGDRYIVPRLVELLRTRKLIGIGNGTNRMHLISARDVATAVLRAADSPCDGAYNLDGLPELTQRQFFSLLARSVGMPPPQRWLPLEIAYVGGFFLEAAARALRRSQPPRLTRYQVALSGGEVTYELDRARKVLGWEPTKSLERSIQEALQSMATGSAPESAKTEADTRESGFTRPSRSRPMADRPGVPL